MENVILQVGKNKNGEFDFGILSTIQNLSQKEMNEFRAMCMVAIGTAEDMFRRAQPNQEANKSYPSQYSWEDDSPF